MFGVHTCLEAEESKTLGKYESKEHKEHLTAVEPTDFNFAATDFHNDTKSNTFNYDRKLSKEAKRRIRSLPKVMLKQA